MQPVRGSACFYFCQINALWICLFLGCVIVSKHVYEAKENYGLGGVRVPNGLVSTQVTMAVLAMMLALTTNHLSY